MSIRSWNFIPWRLGRPSRPLSPKQQAASKTASTPAAGLPPEGTRPAPADPGPPRGNIAFIGTGAGNIAAVHCLKSLFNKVMFEAEEETGGHCHSKTDDYHGTPIRVDLGAQFFHPDTHPLYVTLLEELGLYDPENPDTDETLKAPGSISILKDTDSSPRFSSKHPLRTPLRAIEFAIYARYARKAVLENQDWEMTLEDWVGGLPVTNKFKEKILYPWITAAIGTTLDNAKRTSARSILQTFALAFPSKIFQGASTYNSKLGLQGNLQAILDKNPETQVHTNSAVRSMEYADGKWTLHTDAGSHGPYDAVVMNAPPHTSKKLLEPLPWAGELVHHLNQYEYFDTRLAVHRDAKYVHKDKKNWAAYTVMAKEGQGEGSVWYGGIHPKLPNGDTVDIFKSWVQRRSEDPEDIRFGRSFQHPLITPQAIRAARSLQGMQGRNGLYFSGQAMTGVDSQDAAVYSAMQVARGLAPDSPELLSLQASLERRGRGHINYDL